MYLGISQVNQFWKQPPRICDGHPSISHVHQVVVPWQRVAHVYPKRPTVYHVKEHPRTWPVTLLRPHQRPWPRSPSPLWNRYWARAGPTWINGAGPGCQTGPGAKGPGSDPARPEPGICPAQALIRPGPCPGRPGCNALASHATGPVPGPTYAPNIPQVYLT